MMREIIEIIIEQISFDAIILIIPIIFITFSASLMHYLLDESARDRTMENYSTYKSMKLETIDSKSLYGSSIRI